jgi:putative two-component system response regulator
MKPGPLTTDEFEVMKTHTTLGWQALEHAEQMLGKRVEFLQIAKEIALSHQEWWDGSGYPQGLAGDAIPISARLMALADVYDALVKRRVYKGPMAHAEALRLIAADAGRHFDPDVVQAFVGCHERFDEIAQRYVDGDEGEVSPPA